MLNRSTQEKENGVNDPYSFTASQPRVLFLFLPSLASLLPVPMQHSPPPGSPPTLIASDFAPAGYMNTKSQNQLSSVFITRMVRGEAIDSPRHLTAGVTDHLEGRFWRSGVGKHPSLLVI